MRIIVFIYLRQNESMLTGCLENMLNVFEMIKRCIYQKLIDMHIYVV